MVTKKQREEAARQKAEAEKAAKAQAAQPEVEETTTAIEEPQVEEANGEVVPEEEPDEVSAPDVGLLDADEDLADLGQPIQIDETKESICVAILDKPQPTKEFPLRGRYITIFVQPLTNGSALINYRGAEMWMANGPDGCSIAKGGKSLTAGHRYPDPKTGRLRNVTTGGLGINQQGMKFFLNTPAGKEAFEAVGVPYDDGSPTSLKAQFKGSTLLSRLHKDDRTLRTKRRTERRTEEGASDRPATARGDAVTTGGPSGEQPLGEAEESF